MDKTKFNNKSERNDGKTKFSGKSERNDGKPKFNGKSERNDSKPRFGGKDERNDSNPRFARKDERNDSKPRFYSKDERNDSKPRFNDRNERNDDKEFNENQVEGRNAMLEVLNSGRDVEKILIARGNTEGTIRRIVAMATERGIVVQQTDRQRLDDMSQTKNHQGIIGFVSAHQYVEVEDIIKIARDKGEEPFIILLDGITDPHNLGAIIRTADASGAHGVVIPKRRSVGLTATVSKTSAGAIEYVPVAKVVNLGNTLDDLKKHGIWVACAEMTGKAHFDTDMKGPIALVIGSEGEGVSRLVKEKCDFTVSIPMKGQIASLNASVAAALLMYEVVRQRKG
ncbi:MAG: 23S rRNA (guanosine(2251)-2'-O)-methyltransferase RlmB [Anaerotignaceae bacterium]